MSYADFQNSDVGRALTPILADPEVISRMEALSRRGRPAVEAIGAKISRFAPDLDDTARQHVGRLVRDTLGRRGWRPVRKARVAPGNLFSWGSVYDRAYSADAARQSATERLEKARKIIRDSGIDLGTVDEFIADRRRDWGEEA